MKSRWAAAALLVIAVVVLYGDAKRLLNPVGEKDLPIFPPGQNDFSYPYLGARALLRGVNPYHNDEADLSSQFFGIATIDGVAFKQLYPPSHLLLFVPLAKLAQADWQKAGRIWFHISFLALLALAAIAWTLARRGDPTLTPWLMPLFSFVLVLNVGVALGLERGQSDNFFAFLCWAAVLAFVRGHVGSAVFLATWGTSIKGYPILFLAGLGLLALDRASWKRALGGGALALLFFVAPVARFLGDGWKGVGFRSSLFWDHWYNHSFRFVAHAISPAWADRGRIAMTLAALGATALAWLQARRLRRAGGDHTLWTVLFSTAAQATMIGYSALSVSYNLILVLPGVLVLAVAHERLSSELQLSPRATHAFGAALLPLSYLMFRYRIDWWPAANPNYPGFPAASLGLILLLVMVGLFAARALGRPTPTP